MGKFCKSRYYASCFILLYRHDERLECAIQLKILLINALLSHKLDMELFIDTAKISV